MQDESGLEAMSHLGAVTDRYEQEMGVWIVPYLPFCRQYQVSYAKSWQAK